MTCRAGRPVAVVIPWFDCESPLSVSKSLSFSPGWLRCHCETSSGRVVDLGYPRPGKPVEQVAEHGKLRPETETIAPPGLSCSRTENVPEGAAICMSGKERPNPNGSRVRVKAFDPVGSQELGSSALVSSSPPDSPVPIARPKLSRERLRILPSMLIVCCGFDGLGSRHRQRDQELGGTGWIVFGRGVGNGMDRVRDKCGWCSSSCRLFLTGG